MLMDNHLTKNRAEKYRLSCVEKSNAIYSEPKGLITVVKREKTLAPGLLSGHPMNKPQQRTANDARPSAGGSARIHPSIASRGHFIFVS